MGALFDPICRSPSLLVTLAWLISLTALAATAQSEDPDANDSIEKVFFNKYCFDCHTSKSKEHFDFESLSFTFTTDSDRQTWAKIRDQLAYRFMPPKEELQPEPAERQDAIRWIEAQLIASEQERRKDSGRSPLRRLSRLEYENTIRDLLAVKVDLSDLIPAETNSDGFLNNAESLHFSSFLLDSYLAAADRVLDAAIANGARPNTINRRLDIRDERTVKATGSVYRHEKDGVSIFSSWVSANIQVTLWQFNTRARGKYRVRITAYGTQTDKPITFYVKAGPMNAAAEQYLIGYYSVPPNKPTVVEIVEDMEPNLTLRIVVDGLGVTPPQIEKIGAENYKGPGLLIQHVDIEGPIIESWPPESHLRIFGELKQVRSQSDANRLEVISERPLEDAKQILTSFAKHAFRRPVTEGDIAPFLNRFEKLHQQGRSFEDAMRVALKGILLSPDFLFHREPVGKLDDFAFANRLSYFLWNSMPDEELLLMAEKGKLSEEATVREQVERLLKDPKSVAFRRSFVSQWLSLNAIDDTLPDAMLYPEYDDLLKVSMLQEVHRFFDEILDNNLSIGHFVDSDFTFLNSRLAKHYGIDGVPEGVNFEKIQLPDDSPRGGLLTMAAILKVTANGTTTSPILRGNWVLNRILGSPPPKPPENIEAVEPDIRGATTIRNQLAKHRDLPQCASCHTLIDPHGFALENFDVIGGWRENYRSIGIGEPAVIAGRKMRYLHGPKVEVADSLLDGRAFGSIQEYKYLLLQDRELLAKSFAGKLLSYATGEDVNLADRESIELIIEKTRVNDFGLRSIIQAVIDTPTFRNK
jgi:hypothetical protein